MEKERKKSSDGLQDGWGGNKKIAAGSQTKRDGKRRTNSLGLHDRECGIKTQREPDRERDQGKNPERLWGAEGGIKN